MINSKRYPLLDATSSWIPSTRTFLITSVGCLIVISLMMVASASIPVALANHKSELSFFISQLSYVLLGLMAAGLVYLLPSRFYYNDKTGYILLFVSFVLLILTLLVGKKINGSIRWLTLGSLNFQTAEFVKLAFILFLSDFVVRRSTEVRFSWWAVIRVGVVLGVLAFLLLRQPDFGSLVVIVGCTLAIFLVSGALIQQFIVLGAIVTALGSIAILTSDYRMARMTSFLNPFDDIQDTDFQLARSLVAFGRGEVTGVGYGESVQKLSHLPEAHTDFLLAITGEELGFIGVMTVLILELIVIVCAMKISYLCLKRGQKRMSYTTFGIAIVFLAQTFINAGMNIGILPTKGLTMPFFSYGGSSMVICLVMVAILLRIDKESPTIDTSTCRNY